MEAKLSDDFRAAQEREKERLERQAKRQNEMDHINQMASLISSESLPLIDSIVGWTRSRYLPKWNFKEDFFDEPNPSEKKFKTEPSTSEYEVNLYKNHRKIR